MYSKNPELPINLHEYLVNNDILIYENLRIPQEQESVYLDFWLFRSTPRIRSLINPATPT